MEQLPSITEIDQSFIESLIIPRPEESHKGTFGHSLIVAGSEGKMGAAILAAKAALRTGCGLVSVHITSKAAMPLLAHLPEAMIIPRKKKGEPMPTENYNAIGFGPGVGLTDSSTRLLLFLLENYHKPWVLDADGITLLAQHKDWYSLLYPQIILTPHPKEFDRLTQSHESEEARFERQLKFSADHHAIVVLKGHRTVITLPDGSAYRNTTGNNGMATGGSGDVLTGIITSLCAQGYTPANAAILGTYLHGFSGDVAAKKYSKTSLIASDIIEGIPEFFRQFETTV